MGLNLDISIIVPAYNAEAIIEKCLKAIYQESKNFNSEIIVIDDHSNDKTCEIVEKFKSTKLVKLKENKGVGHARNLGARIARHKILCYIDSDLIISQNSILHLVKKLRQDKNIGSVGAIPEVHNLNSKSWSSSFVCLKSCYGFEHIEKETEVSDIQSEFCVIFKEFLKQIGGWKEFSKAGGEEYDLGYKILQANKKNIKIKDASYKTHWANLYLRFKKNIVRTEKYIYVLLNKKKFDSIGSFATSQQALSSFFTLLMLIFIFLSFYLDKWLVISGLIMSFIVQIIFEYRFLVFAKKYFGLKMLFFSLFGIQIINIGIIFGVIYFFLNKIKIFFLRIISFDHDESKYVGEYKDEKQSKD
jgi:glycosyltransferase involved in cell wall biosynthesis